MSNHCFKLCMTPPSEKRLFVDEAKWFCTYACVLLTNKCVITHSKYKYSINIFGINLFSQYGNNTVEKYLNSTWD